MQFEIPIEFTLLESRHAYYYSRKLYAHRNIHNLYKIYFPRNNYSSYSQLLIMIYKLIFISISIIKKKKLFSDIEGGIPWKSLILLSIARVLE